jgi:UDP-glucose 4-epimerase
MKILITGGAGFIGSHLVERLTDSKNSVVVLDKSAPRRELFQQHPKWSSVEFHQVDLLTDSVGDCFKGIDEVWHLAANPDVRVALENTKLDLEQNILVTFRVLEAMKENQVKRVLFTSTSTIYGEPDQIPTPESYGPPTPISFYGATKLACEALISAYCHTFGLQAVIFRLANVIGPRSTHGVIHDFSQKLRKNPDKLEILGDGRQRKSYLYIDDCIDAMLLAARQDRKKSLDIYNIGSEDWITVKEIARILCKQVGLRPEFKFAGGRRGWKGDVPLMRLDIRKIKSLGWTPMYNSKRSVEIAIQNLSHAKVDRGQPRD